MFFLVLFVSLLVLYVDCLCLFVFFVIFIFWTFTVCFFFGVLGLCVFFFLRLVGVLECVVRFLFLLPFWAAMTSFVFHFLQEWETTQNGCKVRCAQG